jgi:hypothetical protein
MEDEPFHADRRTDGQSLFATAQTRLKHDCTSNKFIFNWNAPVKIKVAFLEFKALPRSNTNSAIVMCIFSFFFFLMQALRPKIVFL